MAGNSIQNYGGHIFNCGPLKFLRWHTTEYWLLLIIVNMNMLIMLYHYWCHMISYQQKTWNGVRFIFIAEAACWLDSEMLLLAAMESLVWHYYSRAVVVLLIVQETGSQETWICFWLYYFSFREYFSLSRSESIIRFTTTFPYSTLFYPQISNVCANRHYCF